MIVDPRTPLTARDFALTELGTVQALHLLSRYMNGRLMHRHENEALDRWQDWLEPFLAEHVGDDWANMEALV